MSLKGQLEAIIYAAEEPVTIDQLTLLLKEAVIADDTTLAALEPSAAQTEAKSRIRAALAELIGEYGSENRGVEVREVAGGYRMSTKPEHHDLVRGYAKSLKPPIRLSLQALETLSVIAYRQPVTAPEISEIRGVDSSGVLANLIDKKLVTTAGRKQVIGRPILYKTTKEFLLRFGLKDVNELPSMEEFEKMLGAATQEELFEPVSSQTVAGSESSSAGQVQAEPASQSESEVHSEPEATPTHTEQG
ncbi:MAG TPA: SMC-Scp complex subunit ScpB [Terriglobales bacterium]|nr:SMC-Scp complex subunit ScpB [Terriglobales bacterium]